MDRADMTHPLTPREKVELKPCPFCGGEAVAGSNFDNDHYVMCGADCDRCGGMVGYMKTEMAAIENWNRRTALASGSGDHSGDATNMIGASDHAELTRTVVAMRRAEIDAENAPTSLEKANARRALKDMQRFMGTKALALLAENAALRERGDRLNERCRRLHDQVASQSTRAAEAERKLTEAVGLNDRAADLMRQCTDPERFEGASTLNVYANMRAWLSDLPPAPGAEA